MTFPTPFEVTWYPFNADVGQDDLGNDKEEWLDPKQRPVIGWEPSRTESLMESSLMSGSPAPYASRSITLVDLQVPPGFTYGLRDRCGLPDGLLYEVVGGADYGKGFHGWDPGGVVRMKRVEG